MLQVSHLSKVYKTKGGADVNALDDVSLTFPERGMVFLLGKSGSGKSTLLNVCGGLDVPSGGEIIVKGRSSKDFTQSDFDSYRNTFIGFIFQEYNILNEFSVEDNIALALELQGKPKDREAINALLSDVDLLGYAKRKPNTLSGGQKQRIAIARALIKAPEIIMADEPTGALDSATGKQVFDTLKKLSKNKLIIVVSHDRDFAEQYGDRIIELKDGRVISDITKTHEEKKELTSNMSAIGDVLCIKGGSRLSDSELAELRSFLEKSENDVIVAAGRRDVENFKTVSRITDDGQKEVFRDTDENKLERRQYSSEESKFIRSKLPIRHAMKIGASSLKTKPFRLFFTVLLCTAAFILFGLLSTMTFYDSDATFRETLMTSNVDMMRITKSYSVKRDEYHNGELEWSMDASEYGKFNDDEVKALAEIYGDGSFGGISYSTSFSTKSSSKYWQNYIYYMAYLPTENILRDNLVSGSKYPKNNDEILISSYIADVIINCKLLDYETGEGIEFDEYSDIIGTTLNMNNTEYKVTGIFNTPALDSKYDALKDSSNINNIGSLEYNLRSELQDGIHGCIFVTEEKLRDTADNYGYYSSWMSNEFEYHNLSVAEPGYVGENEESDIPEHSNAYYAAWSALKSNSIFLNSSKTALASGEALVSSSYYARLMNAYISEEIDKKREAYYEARNSTEYATLHDTFVWGKDLSDDDELVTMYNNWFYDSSIPVSGDAYYDEYLEWRQNVYYVIAPKAAAIEDLEELRRMSESLSNNSYSVYDEENDVYEYYTLSESMRTEYVNALADYQENKGIELSLRSKLYNSNTSKSYGAEREHEIVGVFTSADSQYKVCFADSDFETYWENQKEHIPYYTTVSTIYKEPEGAVYNSVFVSYDRSPAATNKLLSIYSNKDFDENGVRLELNGSIISGFVTVDTMVETLSQVFLYVGLGTALFAALLLSNFISVSISNKKREIGILRAVGARSFDVFKIFFSESFIITAICIALSSVGSILLCGALNASIVDAIGAAIFVFGILSLVVLIGVALLTAVVATFLPVWNAAKKKPVESIRAL